MTNIDDKRAAYLEQIIIDRGMTRRSVSLKVGTGPTLVGDIVTRKTKSPTIKTWDKLARAIGVDVQELLEAAPKKRHEIIDDVIDVLSQIDREKQADLLPQLRGILAEQMKHPQENP